MIYLNAEIQHETLGQLAKEELSSRLHKVVLLDFAFFPLRAL